MVSSRLLPALVVSFAFSGLVSTASAVSFDTVFIGNAGNACDVQPQGCFGSVGSGYAIATTEVTNAQYAEFLNAVADTDANGLYNTNMATSPFGGITRTGSSGIYSYSASAGRESLPVNFVSWYDALRFANWLHNGQPDTGSQTAATTEDGAYTFSILLGTPGPRNPGATAFLPSEDEWYKAAYYDALSTSYFDGPAGSNAVVSCMAPTGAANSANCDAAGLDASDPDVDDLTGVGLFTGSASPYGTFDQGGNVWEWNEALIENPDILADDFRGLRGGSFLDDPSALVGSTRGSSFPTVENASTGFRVAFVPEPGTALLLALGLLGLAGRGRLRAARSLPIALLAIFMVIDPDTARAQETRPWTIPALREWTPGAGSFEVTESSRVVALDAALLAVAEVFAEDLEELLGHPVAVVGPPAAVTDGDLVLGLGETDGRLGHEGYRAVIDTAGVEITAVEDSGVFYGTRTILQLLNQASAIPAGEALDWPRYPERGLMIDAGRKYFTPGWIERHIKELAYLKMNYFHLHFSDNGGFRLQSDTHPEIVSADHLTKQELADILALAERYHVMVVPELDMPGHMSGALAAHPEFRLRNALGQANASRLDITNPDALAFVQELMEEFLPLFPGRYWHIGADEYMLEAEYQNHPQLQTYAQQKYGPSATHKDAVLGFINWADAIVRAHGKTTRMWHDELYGGSEVAVNPDVVVEWWSNLTTLSALVPPSPQEILERGHWIHNSGWFPTYYNAGASGEALPRADMGQAYEEWEVNEFAGPFFSRAAPDVQDPPAVISPDEPRNLGSKVNVWTADVESEESIEAGIRTFLRVIAQKTWNSPLLTTSYDGYQAIMDAVGRSPGFHGTSPTEVGFWAQQNASAMDPHVLDVLRDTGGSIYLLINYLADYGPPGFTPTSNFARDATLLANARGVPVNAWIILPVQDGIFAHENNAELVQEAVESLPAWAAAEGLAFREVTLDLEFPVGNEAVFDAFFAGDPTALAGLMQSNIDPVHQCQAIATYRDTISWAHANGLRIAGSPAPFYLDDINDGFIALQDSLDGVAWPPLGYDDLYLQAYRTYSNAGPGYVAEFYRDMQAEFGATGEVSLGDTQQGAPYDTLQPLVDDVRMLAGMGATRIPIFELGGTVDRFGTDGLRAIVEAVRQPMTGAELTAASTEQPYDAEHRTFFQQLDDTAVTLTNVVTAPPGEPDGPNAYPDGCGDPQATTLPEPAPGLACLAALALLARLNRRRAARARRREAAIGSRFSAPPPDSM